VRVEARSYRPHPGAWPVTRAYHLVAREGVDRRD
jgi:hypothetical protein